MTSYPILVLSVPPAGSSACGIGEQRRLRREAGSFPSGFAAREKYLNWRHLPLAFVDQSLLVHLQGTAVHSPEGRATLPFQQPPVSSRMEHDCLGDTELRSALLDSILVLLAFRGRSRQ